MFQRNFVHLKETKYLHEKTLFLSDVFVGKIPTFVSLQRYYESTIPHWFINFNEFNDIFINNGYKLILKRETVTKRLNYKNKLPMQNFNRKYVFRTPRRKNHAELL